MSKHYLPAELREQLLTADDRRCAYCHTTEANTGQPMTVDHIIPLTGEIVSLFHPRSQTWSGHFAWDASGTHVTGLTAIGRATIVALNMNNAVIVDVRRRWVSVGWHPPEP